MPQSEPSQMIVLYPRLPDIDTSQLRADVQAFEPDGPDVQVSPFESKDIQGTQVHSGVVTLGDLHVAIQIHDKPLDREIMRFTVGASNLTDESKGPMRMHQAYALVSLAGNAEPSHKMGALLKVAGGMVQQGGVGLANLETWSAYIPAVTEFMQKPGFWPEFYTKGIPAVMAVGFVKVNRGDELWFMTKGHRLYGLPDLAYRANGHDEAAHIFDLFSNIYHYMMDVGPVIKAGHTMEMESGGDVMRFEEADENFLDEGTLIVSMESDS